MKAERVVIDTNVLISAALTSASLPAKFVDWALENTVVLLSPSTFEELETRLWRPKLDRYISMEQRRMILHDLAASALWLTPESSAMPPFSRDSDDDKFIYLALAGNASWLVTGDQDLLVLDRVESLEIITPAEAWARVAG